MTKNQLNTEALNKLFTDLDSFTRIQIIHEYFKATKSDKTVSTRLHSVSTRLHSLLHYHTEFLNFQTWYNFNTPIQPIIRVFQQSHDSYQIVSAQTVFSSLSSSKPCKDYYILLTDKSGLESEHLLQDLTDEELYEIYLNPQDYTLISDITPL